MNEEILEIFEGICPELNLYQKIVTEDYRWFWEFRGLESSAAFDHKSDGCFANPIEAFASFTQHLIYSQDKKMGLYDLIDDEE